MTDQTDHSPSYGRLLLLLCGTFVFFSVIAASFSSRAADQLVRIGTGSTASTYYQMGKAISAAISNPELGSDLTCEEGGSCGVPGLIAVVQASDGSVQNIINTENRVIDLALGQADIADWAYRGVNFYENQPALSNLRAIAYLFPSEMHVVVPSDSPLLSISEFGDLRVSMGALRSATVINTRGILPAYGLEEADIRRRFLDEERALDHLSSGRLDALFSMAGAPALGLAHLAAKGDIRFLPITGEARAQIMGQSPHYAATTIPAETYGTETDIETVEVGTLLLVGAHLSLEVVYQITYALWHPNNSAILRRGHSKALNINVLDALRGIPIPLHEGAARFYQELSDGAYGDRLSQATPP